MDVLIVGKRWKVAIKYVPNYIVITFNGLDTYCYNEITLDDVQGEPFTAEELIAEITLVQEKPEVYGFK